MYVVGLTGGIGSGKSTVTNHFINLGIEVVDTDLIAREVVEPGEPSLVQIALHFGQDILLDDGSLDRAKLRRLVFDQPEQREWLEQLLHPIIRKRTVEHLHNAQSPYALLVSPLLLETDQYQLADHIVIIDVPEELQITRTVLRDRNTADQVRAIMKAQCSRQERIDRADSIIDNSVATGHIENSVQTLHQKFLALTAATR